MFRQMMLTGLCLGSMGTALAQTSAAVAPGTLVYIGTLGSAILGARLDTTTGDLSLLGPVAQIERPSWFALDPKRPILYAVSETGNAGGEQGGVYSLAIDPATGVLKVISRVDSGGGGATYLSYDSRVNTVFVANYFGGQVAAIPVQNDGSLSPASSIQTDTIQTETGIDSKPLQRSVHAHGATLDPSGQFVLTPDLGADRVFIRRFDVRTRTLAPADTPFVETGPGTGPRHLVFSPDGHFVYLLTEVSAEVRSFRWDAQTGRLQPVANLAIDPPDFKGTRSAAEIVISRDGRFLYISNRAQNTLLVYAVDETRGTITLQQEIACGGKSPRSFAIDPSGRWMIVANRTSRTLAIFKIDQVTGTLTAVGQPLHVDQEPVAFAFYRP